MTGGGHDERSGARVNVRTRWDDCDRYGHVNNAAYLALMRAAHDAAGQPAGELRSVEIGYRQPVPPDVIVNVDVIVLEQTASWQRIAYTIEVDHRPAAELTALWQFGGPPLDAGLPPVDRDVAGRTFCFSQAVHSHELGPNDSARPQAVLQWLEHAVFRAADLAGWPGQRMEREGFVTFVVGHHLILGAPAREHDELAVTSRLIELRRVSGTWHHEVRRADGSLVAADRARGAFLDLEGRIRPAPPGLLEDLLGGEPAD
jgi:acyl-CoA thioesterase FadM